MGLWSRVADFALRRSGGVTDLFSLFEEWGRTGSGVPVNSFSAMQHVAVMACVAILSEDVAKLPLQVYRRMPNGGKRLAEDHPVHGLLRAPNSWQTQFEWLENQVASLALRGNAYSVILRDGRGRIEQLMPVHPDRVMLYEAPDGTIFYLVTPLGLHETAMLRDVPHMVPSDDILHVRWLSSWNSLIGLSRIALMRETIGMSMAQLQMASRIAGNGARPGGVLQTEKRLSKEVVERLRTSFDDTYSGWRNAGKTAILEEGLKWEPLGMTMVDAEFMSLMNFSIEDIARGFRVPLHLLGVPQSGGESTLAQIMQGYLNTTISGFCRRIKLRAEADFDLDGKEFFLEFDYSKFLEADAPTRYAANRTAIIGSFKTVNEIRRLEGDPDVPDGDTMLQPVNMAPLGFEPSKAATGGPGSDATGAPGVGGNGDETGLPGEAPEPKE